MNLKHKLTGIIALSSLILNLLPSCSFFTSLEDNSSSEITINSLSLSKSTLEAQVGSMEYISVSVKPTSVQKDIKLNWSYDSSIIECDTSSSWGVTIKGLSEGQTTLRCSYGGYDSACLVTISGYAEPEETTTEPYIYSNYSILQTAPGVSEKVFVSLYGGDASDIDGYSWTVDNSSVATIQPTGQYCVITAKEAGYARIKITHNKAAYPYYMGVYVFEDATKVGYITTTNNIVTMNMEDEDKTVSVSLVNGKDTSLDSSFSWEIITDNGSSVPIELNWNGNNAVISPKTAGSCTLRVTHPDATYPLDILCRVISVVKNVYIQPDNTVVTLSGTTEQTVTSELVNLDKSEYNIDGFTYALDDYNVAEIISSVGNQVTLRGLANGSCKLIISHEKSAYSREVLLIVNGQLKDAVDASCYVTTSQNYIRTKVGEAGQTINISLKGGEDGDEAGFTWSVTSTASDGSSSKVINLETATGSVFHTSARSAAATYSYGSAFMEPLCEGTAVITITHPKILYPTEILVKVLSKDAVLEEPLYFSGSGLVKILNGDSQEYEVTLKGDSKTSSDDNDIKWECDTDYLELATNANIATIKAPALETGSTMSYITISHPKATTNKTVLVMTADDIDTLNSMKALYSDKTYYNIENGTTASCYVSTAGFEDDYDFSTMSWIVKDPLIISIEKSSFNPLACRITGLKSGTTTLTASIAGTSCEFNITVYPKGAVSVEPEVYFTTNQNVISLSGSGQSVTASVTAVNLSSSEYSNIVWESSDSAIATVIGNGTNATVTAVSEGDAVITVTHKDSQNTMKIYIRVGSEYVMEETESVVYIKADDFITVVKGDEDKKLTATLVNWTSSDSSGFSFTSKDSSIAKIASQSTNGTAYIEGVSKGYTEIIISHSATKVSKSVLVFVGETQEEVNAIVKSSVYMTTSNNTLTFTDTGKSSTVSIKAFNLDTSKYSGITWTSADDSIAQVRGNGTSATIYAQSKGSTTVTASYLDSINSITFYIFVSTEDIVPASTGVVYISATDVMTFLKGGSSQSLQAVLVNYDGQDTSGFSFTIDDTAVAEITAQSTNGVAYIKPVGSGQAQITITNTKTSISKKVLVVVGNSAEELAGYVYLTTSTNVVAVGEGNTKSVSISVKNASSTVVDGYTWLSSNPGIIDVTPAGATAVLKGNSIGTALITVTNTACQYSLTIIAQCVDPVAASANPYIQLSSSVLTVNVSSTYTSITADLVGGTTDDYANFVWSSNDSSICAVYGQNEVGKIKAVAAGQTYITVSHPKAAYSAQILVVCDEVQESECYISVPSSIITMKPTASAQTVTATLVNGTSTDKYNFSWSLDVYDVIDFQYSANVCTITPKQTGSATITISHPKAAYNQQIIVNVQEYTDFAFPQSSISITQGTVSFQNMQVPTTTVTTHVEYSVENSNICSITGTKSVAQITGIAPGTTTVTAKLVASSTGVVQSTSEMLVYVKEASTTAVYITSSSTIYTLNKGKSQSLSATLSGTGVTSSDQYNMKWTTNDTDIIQITGISSDGTVSGQSIYITALKSGEALITCSHEKAASTLQFYVVVPGSAEKTVSLNKTYLTLTKGSSGSTLKATIENAESSSDYNSLEWSAETVNGNEIVRVMGNGQTVTIYPISTGQTTVMAQLPDTTSVAKCTVVVEAGKSFAFETSSKSVQPKHSKKVKYTVSPPDATLNWTMSQEKDFFEYHDLGCDTNGVGYVEITGLLEGTGTLACVTDGSAKGSLTVKIAWDYEFTVDTTRVSGSPDSTYTVEYSVSPTDATIEVDGNGLCEFSNTNDGLGNGKITIMPHTEGTDSITIKARNPNDSNKEIGSYAVTGKFYYDSLSVSYTKQSDVSYADNTKTAYWSKFSGDSITLGDGEKMTFKFNVSEAKTKDLTITASLQTKKNGNISLSNGATAGQFILSHNSDVTTPAYKITTGYKPTYNGSSSYPDGTPIKMSDFYSSTNTDSDSYKDWTSPVTYDTHYDRRGWWYLKNSATSSNVYYFDSGWIHSSTRTVTLTSKTGQNSSWGRTRDSSLDGKCMSVEEFQNCAWYYIPSFTVTMGGDCTSYLKHNYGEIDTDHISATYYSITPDTSVVKSEQADVLVVTFSHNGTKTTKYYPIYLETRNSACTSK